MNDIESIKKKIENIVISYLINKLKEKLEFVKGIKYKSFSEIKNKSTLIVIITLYKTRNEEDVFSIELLVPIDMRTGDTDINSLKYEIVANNVPFNDSSQNQLLNKKEISQLIEFVKSTFNSD